jgi:UDP-2,4-diacetamido-2,4,6-trideoxy-beta-L-altropyranose hydrolase
MRCTTLADALAADGWRCSLAANAGSRAFLQRFRDLSHELAEDCTAPDVLRARFPDGCDLLVVDDYTLDATYESVLRGWAKTILAIDDLAQRPHACDLLLDPTLGRTPSDYSSLVPDATRLLLGSAYALLRSEFRKRRSEALARRKADQPVRRIVVSLGGAPPEPLLQRVLVELCDALNALESGAGIEVDVVAGPVADRVSAIRNERIRVRRPDEICQWLAAADLAIGAAGTSAWERCCLGLPTVMLQVADNQALVARRLQEAGAALNLGAIESLGAGQIGEAVRGLIENPAERARMARAAALVCDGLGVRRVVGAIAPEHATDGTSVILRPAGFDDGEMMLHWQRLPETRRYALDPSIPAPDAHFAWLRGRLEDPLAGPFNIIEYGGTPAGVLRLDRDADVEDSYTVSILVVPELHGRGVASAALRAGGRLLGEGTLNATVLLENTSSHRLFRGAGFEQVDATSYKRNIAAH